MYGFWRVRCWLPDKFYGSGFEAPPHVWFAVGARMRQICLLALISIVVFALFPGSIILWYDTQWGMLVQVCFGMFQSIRRVCA